jgi:hypothetical protein
MEVTYHLVIRRNGKLVLVWRKSKKERKLEKIRKWKISLFVCLACWIWFVMWREKKKYACLVVFIYSASVQHPTRGIYEVK